MYNWIDYPDFDKERRIVSAKVPGAPERLAEQVTAFVQELRTLDLYKARGRVRDARLGRGARGAQQTALTLDDVEQTLGVLLKHQDDIDTVRGERLAAICRASACARS